MAVKKGMSANDLKAAAMREIEKSKKLAEKEIAKLRKTMDASLRQAESFVKKNPAKAAGIAAGVGVALGAALTMLMRGGKRK